MAKNNKGLGRGLDALLKMNVAEETNDEVINQNNVIAGFVELDIDRVVPNPDQPRKNFSEESIENLAQSIKNFGIIQPITVSKKGDSYEIIAGERRYRAAKSVGLTKIPVIIKNLSQKEKLEISLIENIQRENLNPIEEALAYSNLIDSFGITQEELADSIGKSRTSITNFIRLLNLDIEIQKWIMDGTITPGHARTILSLQDKKYHIEFAKYIINNNLSVREAEGLTKKWPISGKETQNKKNSLRELEIQNAEKELERKLQTRVQILGNSLKGKIQIEYFNQDELERLLELFNLKII